MVEKIFHTLVREIRDRPNSTASIDKSPCSNKAMCRAHAKSKCSIM